MTRRDAVDVRQRGNDATARWLEGTVPNLGDRTRPICLDDVALLLAHEEPRDVQCAPVGADEYRLFFPLTDRDDLVFASVARVLMGVRMVLHYFWSDTMKQLVGDLCSSAQHETVMTEVVRRDPERFGYAAPLGTGPRAGPLLGEMHDAPAVSHADHVSHVVLIAPERGEVPRSFDRSDQTLRNRRAPAVVGKIDYFAATTEHNRVEQTVVARTETRARHHVGDS